MHKSDHWQVQHETAKEEYIDDSDDDSESYEFIDGERELHFSTMHFSKSKETSEYADKRYFKKEMDTQTFNNLSPAVHHVSRSTIAEKPQVQRSHCKQSRLARDQRMLGTTNFKDTTSPQRSTPINSNDCEQNSIQSSSKTWDTQSHPTKGPDVNRSLKPQKRICQVNGSTPSTHEIHKSNAIINELSRSIQPNAMPTKLSAEKKCESTANRRIILQSSCKDNSNSSLIKSHQTSTIPRSKTEADCTAERMHSVIKQIPQWPHPVIIPKVPAVQQKQTGLKVQRDVKQRSQLQYPKSKTIVPVTEQKTETRHLRCPSVQRYKDSEEDLSLAERLQQQLQSFDDKIPNMLPEKPTWYQNEYDRHKAEHVLYEENKNGAFLVRDNSHKTSNEPYVLSVYYNTKVYHIKIRYLEDTRQYALGTGRRGNYKFSSVEDILEFHRRLPLLLVDGRTKSNFQGHQCFLTRPPVMTGRMSSHSI